MKKTMPLYQVDAFTKKTFGGNPASVCVLQSWLDDVVLQKIAKENNQPETAFVVANNGGYTIRWFTPICEVDLCGHATLAAAFVLFNYEHCQAETIRFSSISRGELIVSKVNDLLELDFPIDVYESSFIPYGLVDSFGHEPKEVYRGKDDYLLVFENEQQIKTLKVDMEGVKSINARGVICTAPGDDVDFVSRFFGPRSGIDEDPVTGSAHTTLAPYWAKRLHKTVFSAIQLSERGGALNVTLNGDRVLISGSAKLYMKGEIFLD